METIQNGIGGRKITSVSQRFSPVFNPATGEGIARLPLSQAAEVNAAVETAKKAATTWGTTPPTKRVKPMFKFKELLEKNADKIARAISAEHGKTHADALGELQRGIDVVDFACGIPHLLKGEFSSNVGPEMDISLEKKAYDVASKYGDAAIAFLLAHELVHYYEKHGWRSQYADAISDLETGKVLKSLDDRVVNEVQADVLGGFLAYSAGFGIFDKGGQLIDDSYKGYKMGDKMFGYPSKKDRISLSERNKDQIAKLSNMFEMAGLLTVVGKYNEAYSYYGFLLNKYQSRELYNNAGLTCMMKADSLLKSDSIIFDLPAVIDIEFYGDSRNATTFEDINKLIDEALIHFETSVIMNKAYLPSHINKVSAQIIKAINYPAREMRKIVLNKANYILDVELEEMKRLHPELDFDRYNNEILILRSILAYFKNDKTTSVALMSKAIALGNQTAIKNLSILKGTPISISENNKMPQISIEGMTAEKFLTAQLVGRNQTPIDSINTFRVTDQKTENYKVLTHDYKGNDQDFGYDLGFVVT